MHWNVREEGLGRRCRAIHSREDGKSTDEGLHSINELDHF